MKKFNSIDILKYYPLYKENSITGRYITLKDIEPLINKYKSKFKIQKIGLSYLQQPIYSIKLGTGEKKLLIWSQMHGNESTGTKAIFDFLSYISQIKEDSLVADLLNQVTFLFIPILNPDGAEKYTRVNAQEIDLNRDAVALKAPESQLLRKILVDFDPDYCFNLHDQRTIFSVGKENNPATISLLAPSENIAREVTPTRTKTMEVIVSIYQALTQVIPNHIGRYTDEFYPTATGDNFQKDGYSTVLIEAGHFIDDYNREQTRMYFFLALLSAFNAIANELHIDYTRYFEIPNNKKDFFDLLYTNIIINNEHKIVGITFKESLKQNKIVYKATYQFLSSFRDKGYNTLINKDIEFNSLNEFKDFITNIKKL